MPSKHPKIKAAAALRALSSDNTVEGGIAAAVRAVRSEAPAGTLIQATDTAPYDPEVIARALGAREIRSVESALDGRIVGRPGCYTIELNRDAPESRVRFTIAHEAGHLLLWRLGAAHRPAARSRAYDETERLCNAIAAEILMPRDEILQGWRERRGLGPAASTKFVISLTASYNVSIASAAKRFIDVCVKRGIGFALFDLRAGRFEWSYRVSEPSSVLALIKSMNDFSKEYGSLSYLPGSGGVIAVGYRRLARKDHYLVSCHS